MPILGKFEEDLAKFDISRVTCPISKTNECFEEPMGDIGLENIHQPNKKKIVVLRNLV